MIAVASPRRRCSDRQQMSCRVCLINHFELQLARLTLYARLVCDSFDDVGQYGIGCKHAKSFLFFPSLDQPSSQMTMPGDMFPLSIVRYVKALILLCRSFVSNKVVISYFGDSLVSAVQNGDVPQSRLDVRASLSHKNSGVG